MPLFRGIGQPLVVPLVVSINRRQFLHLGTSVALALAARDASALVPLGGSVAGANQAWQFSDLITGYTPSSGTFGNGTYGWATQNDGGTSNTATWNPSGLGQFLRIAANSIGTYGLRWTTSATGMNQVCVQYDIRRFQNNCSKQLKTYGWGLANPSGSPPTSNCTIGCTMGGYAGTAYGLYYGDAATGSNDATCPMDCKGYPTGSLPTIGYGGSFSRTPYPTQSLVTPAGIDQDITGTVFETYMAYFKASSNATNDGEVALWKKIAGVWTLILHETAMWNCSANTQDRGGCGLYEYSGNVGTTFGTWVEDYRNFFLMFSKPVGMGV
jgi:hypothetical protein